MQDRCPWELCPVGRVRWRSGMSGQRRGVASPCSPEPAHGGLLRCLCDHGLAGDGGDVSTGGVAVPPCVVAQQWASHAGGAAASNCAVVAQGRSGPRACQRRDQLYYDGDGASTSRRTQGREGGTGAGMDLAMEGLCASTCTKTRCMPNSPSTAPRRWDSTEHLR